MRKERDALVAQAASASVLVPSPTSAHLYVCPVLGCQRHAKAGGEEQHRCAAACQAQMERQWRSHAARLLPNPTQPRPTTHRLAVHLLADHYELVKTAVAVADQVACHCVAEQACPFDGAHEAAGAFVGARCTPCTPCLALTSASALAVTFTCARRAPRPCARQVAGSTTCRPATPRTSGRWPSSWTRATASGACPPPPPPRPPLLAAAAR